MLCKPQAVSLHPGPLLAQHQITRHLNLLHHSLMVPLDTQIPQARNEDPTETTRLNKLLQRLNHQDTKTKKLRWSSLREKSPRGVHITTGPRSTILIILSQQAITQLICLKNSVKMPSKVLGHLSTHKFHRLDPITMDRRDRRHTLRLVNNLLCAWPQAFLLSLISRNTLSSLILSAKWKTKTQ